MNKKRSYHTACMTKGVLNGMRGWLRQTNVGDLLVRHKKISPQELRQLLSIQQRQGGRLGQIAIKLGKISPCGLALLLVQQKAIRTMAAFFACVISLLMANTSKARADNIEDIPALLKVAYTPDYNRFSFIKKHPRLFGMKEIKSSDLKEFTKWTSMFDRLNEELTAKQPRNSLAKFQKKLKPLIGKPPMTMIEKINDMVNGIDYVEDGLNWGKSDYWATPAEFLENGGDCEDYAITKYVALRALGFPENRLRLAIVKDLIKGIPHAVLIVYTDEGPVLLDNQNTDVKFTHNVFRYKPFFSINRHAWWLHSPDTASAPAIIASAD